MLLCLGKSPSPLCSFCKFLDKTLTHLFGSCNQVISLWIEIKFSFQICTINAFISTDCYFCFCKS